MCVHSHSSRISPGILIVGILSASLAAYCTDKDAEAQSSSTPASGQQQAQATPAAPDGFVLVRSGSFQMGSPADESGHEQDQVLHEVTLTRDFFVQQHEVTQGEWFNLMRSRPSRYAECGDECPVESVNWYEAIAYANAFSREHGLSECYQVSGAIGSSGAGCERVYGGCDGDFQYSTVLFLGLDCEGYRLPTEAEWEYAARAGTSSPWYSDRVTEIGWLHENSDVSYGGCESYSTGPGPCTTGPHPVGEKRPNGWGIYDMAGNVAEWLWDYYGDYPTAAVTDPLVNEPGQPTDEVRRCSRPGSFGSRDRRTLRSAERGWQFPARRSHERGFRLVRTAQ